MSNSETDIKIEQQHKPGGHLSWMCKPKVSLCQSSMLSTPHYSDSGYLPVPDSPFPEKPSSFSSFKK